MSIPCSKSKPDNPLSPQTNETFIGQDRTLESRETTRKSGQRSKQKTCDQERMTITPIAHIHTPFSEKFGIPRQSGLVDIPATIVFTPPFRRVEAVRGLETFSHVWLIWQFSKTPHTQKNLTVRPPRLGGNRRLVCLPPVHRFAPIIWDYLVCDWCEWILIQNGDRCCMSAAPICSIKHPSMI